MKRILFGLALSLLVTPSFAIDAWPQCNSPLRDAKVLFACTQVIGHGYMAKTTAAAAYDHRAQANLTLGRFDTAAADATNALAMLPEPGKEIGDDVKFAVWAQEIRVESLAVRAAAYRKKGQNDLADADQAQSLALVGQLIAAHPSAENHNLRAWAGHEMGKDADVLADATKAVDMATAIPEVFSTRGTIEEALGHKDDAIADYRAALKLLTVVKQPTDFQTTRIWFNVQALQRLGEKP